MIKPKKSLGQHFLLDKNIIQKIIKKARLRPDDIVVEIGAGKGELTFPLAYEVAHVFAIEKDNKLFSLLRDSIVQKGISNVTLVKEDVLKCDFSEIRPLIKERKAVVLGNIPYNISSPLIEKLIEKKALIERAVIMLQVEFARRLVAFPNTKEYGALTVVLGYHATVRKLFEVSRNAFFPRPKVDSMVVEIVFDKEYPEVDESSFRLFVHGAFAHRRKKIINSLAGYLGPMGIGKEELGQMLKRCGIDPDKRAQSLGIEDFLCLASFYN